VNELLQQFLIESRELAEAASSGLMALERSPGDRERLDEVLRAFHTLKGGAGIVGFHAMERAVHAIEDVLTSARAQMRPLTPSGIGQCVASLDRVADWLDVIERTGELPEGASSQADGLVSRLEAEAAKPASDSMRIGARPSDDWPADILGRHPGVAARALTAVRFVPARDCLYRGEDPLDRMMTLPHLVALELAANEPWGPLEALDPFSCNLAFDALSAAPAAHVEAHLEGHSGHCEIVPITPGVEDSELAVPPNVRAVIKAQQALLTEGSPLSFAGRVASAGLAAANALRFCKRSELSLRVSRATEQSLLALSSQPLQQALAQLLGGDASGAELAMTAEAVPSSEGAARTLRIDAAQVDTLVRLAGELTVINNAIGHLVKLARAGDPSLADLLKERHGALEHLVAELQRSVVRMRVRPLRSVLHRFPRLVREMSATLGKSVKVIIEGDETEADRTIVEMLYEPLLHLVRNALDHGVEREGERVAAGKPAVASLRIRAERRAEQVLIEVSDDGAGIDAARVREVAMARGLITSEELLTMTDAAALELLFTPGFSTASTVTEVSGRGVGMDAVRRAVERIGGHISIASVPGKGTDVRLSLPFSVMMSHVMTVEAGGQMFGLPLEAIVETIRVPLAAISSLGTAPVVVLRNRALPVIDVATVLGLETSRLDDDGATLVVAAANGEWGAFRVDRIVERLDLIMSPLEGLLAGTPGIMGTSLLGDGRVLLVLDVGEMLQ
jgi:two-component system chemotaxis sensor kinase CheA